MMPPRRSRRRTSCRALVSILDGLWPCWQGCGAVDAAVRPVLVVVRFVLAHRVEQVRLVADEHPVEQLVPTGLNRPFHDGVHAWHLDTGEYDLDGGVGEDRVEHWRVFGVAVADEETYRATGVLQVHAEIAYRLRHPCGGRMRRRAESPDPPGGVLDHGEDVGSRAGEGERFHGVGGEDRLSLRP